MPPTRSSSTTAAKIADRRDFCPAVMFGMSPDAFTASVGFGSAFADVGIVEPFRGAAGRSNDVVAGGVSACCEDGVGADGDVPTPVAFNSFPSTTFTAADVEVASVALVVPADARVADGTAESALAETGFAAAGPAEIVIDA